MVEESEEICILHVDPDPEYAQTTRERLEERDGRLSVQTANGVPEGRSLLGRESFDCVLSEYDFPDADGIGFLSTVRDEHEAIPFVLLSAQVDEQVRSVALSDGVTEYFPKVADTEQYAVLGTLIVEAVEANENAHHGDRLDRINRLMRAVNGRLVDARTRPEIESIVCESLTESDQYRFAWIGQLDPETKRIEPSTAAGDAKSYLDAIELRYDDSPLGRGPAGRAVRTHEPQVAQRIPSDPDFEPWRENAAKYGFESAIALPVVHSGEVDSVLAIYAGQPEAFTATERTVLSELAETIARALEAIEIRHRLVAHEQELQRTNAMLSTLFDALPVGVVAEDDSRRVMAANDRFCELFEIPSEPDDVVGADCSVLAEQAADSFEDPAAFVDAIADRIDARTPVHGEELALADGRTFARTYLPIDLPTGEGHLWVYWDVTERKEREQRLERQNERLDTFSSVVSHDLRNPLNVADGHLELAREECPSDHLDRVESAHDRIRQLIEDLLAVAREGAQSQEFEPVDIDVLFENCLRTVDTADAVVETETDVVVLADESRLQQLVENLLRNAIEFGGEDVTITVGDHGDGFYVADDGPGIPEDEREDVFEPGYTSREGGTGFGLSIVRRIAEAHGWSVRVTESESGGARFEFGNVGTVEET